MATRRGIALTLGLLTVLFSSCTDYHVAADAEADLWDRFLEPIGEAGIGYAVTDTCHHADPSADTWTLQVTVRLDYPKDEVADALEGFVRPIARTDDLFWPVQQETRTDHGWAGSLEETLDGGSRMTLTRPRIKVNRHPGPGWMPVCPPDGDGT